MDRKLFVLLFVPLLVGIVSTRTYMRAQGQPAAPASQSGLDLAALDKSADACSDFYQFACGGWIKANPLPGDQPRYGRFDELQERNNAVLRDILEAAAKSNATDADTRRIGDYYASCMDEKAIHAKGLRAAQGGPRSHWRIGASPTCRRCSPAFTPRASARSSASAPLLTSRTPRL